MLSPYENEILSLLAAGRQEVEIARHFGVSEQAIRADIEGALRTLCRGESDGGRKAGPCSGAEPAA